MRVTIQGPVLHKSGYHAHFYEGNVLYSVKYEFPRGFWSRKAQVKLESDTETLEIAMSRWNIWPDGTGKLKRGELEELIQWLEDRFHH